MNSKELVLNTIKNMNAEDLKDYLLEQIQNIGDECFIEGHDNGYDDGDGALRDVYVNCILFDCRN